MQKFARLSQRVDRTPPLRREPFGNVLLAHRLNFPQKFADFAAALFALQIQGLFELVVPYCSTREQEKPDRNAVTPFAAFFRGWQKPEERGRRSLFEAFGAAIPLALQGNSIVISRPGRPEETALPARRILTGTKRLLEGSGAPDNQLSPLARSAVPGMDCR